MNETLKTIISIFASKKCLRCGELLEIAYPRYICPACESFMSGSLRNDSIDIRSKYIYADKFLYYYNNEDIRSMVMRMKNSPRFDIADFFAAVTVDCITEDERYDGIDIVTNCPRKPSRVRRIGGDHSALFAKYIASYLNIPFMSLLKRHDGGKEQKRLNARQRELNVLGKFYINKRYSCKGKKILLVDDIITTGSTVCECARVLKGAGARRVVAAFILN